MRAFQIAALVETAVRDERERGIIRSKALEDAARQALEALENPWEAGAEGVADAVFSLRAALAEPVCNCDMRTRLVGDGCEVCNPERAQDLAEPDQEPVPSAWRYKDTARICDNSDKRMTAPPGWVPLYSAPPQRKPLTDEEIDGLPYGNPASFDDGLRDFARAIERAHGIKENP